MKIKEMKATHALTFDIVWIVEWGGLAGGYTKNKIRKYFQRSDFHIIGRLGRGMNDDFSFLFLDLKSINCTIQCQFKRRENFLWKRFTSSLNYKQQPRGTKQKRLEKTTAILIRTLLFTFGNYEHVRILWSCWFVLGVAHLTRTQTQCTT